MSFIEYLDQVVEVITTQGEIIRGIVVDHMDPEDNNPPFDLHLKLTQDLRVKLIHPGDLALMPVTGFTSGNLR